MYEPKSLSSIVSLQEQQRARSLEAQLNAQTIQNALLQRKVEGELLMSQLRQIQGSNQMMASQQLPHHTGPISPVQVTTMPVSSPSHAPPMVPQPVPATSSAISPQAQQPVAGVDESYPGGVKTLKSTYEQKSPPPISQDLYKPPGASSPGPSNVASPVTVVTVTTPHQAAAKSPSPPTTSTSSVTQPPSPPRVAAKPPSPPPPPPVADRPPLDPAFLNGETTSPKPALTVTKSPPPTSPKPSPPSTVTATTGTIIPPVPGPPPPIRSTSTDPTTPAVITTPSGRAKIVRIGNIQWPPPTEEVKKTQEVPGKLSIVEIPQKAEEITQRPPKTPTKKKPPAPVNCILCRRINLQVFLRIGLLEDFCVMPSGVRRNVPHME